MTGAAGLTGKAVVEELVARGHRVIGVVRRPNAAEAIRTVGATPVMADCADSASLRPILRDADGVVHVAGILLGRALADAGLDHLHHALAVSTAGVYSRARALADVYRRNEDALTSAHPGILFIRPTMIYGSARDRNVHRAIAFARRWRFLPLPSGGHGLVQPIHYADLARAIATLADRQPSGVVDAGGPEPMTIREAGAAIFEALGQPAQFVPVPIASLMPVAAILDRLSGSRWRERLLRSREDRTVDNGRLLDLTGIRLRSFSEGVREQVAMMVSPS